jgi:hypothetical protein
MLITKGILLKRFNILDCKDSSAKETKREK